MEKDNELYIIRAIYPVSGQGAVTACHGIAYIIKHGSSFGIDGSENTRSFDVRCLKSGVGKPPCRSLEYLHFKLQHNCRHKPSIPVHMAAAFAYQNVCRLPACE
jgi:hypothetical protein